MRLLVAHPVLAAELDQAALNVATYFAPDRADMLEQLVEMSREMGAHANFATLAELLRSTGSDFDPLIAEIAADTESNIDVARLELAGAIRQTKMKVLAAEMETLIATGLGSEEAQSRYRDLTLQQEQLRRQAQAEKVQRD